tara:strand:- start:6 stop:710 length:705 start_codon:yes stop_codon:yes gene_type:complete
MKKLLCVLIFGMMFGQAKLETRIYSIENFSIAANEVQYFDLDELTGYSISYAQVSIFRIDNLVSYDSQSRLYFQSHFTNYGGGTEWTGFYVNINNYNDIISDANFDQGGYTTYKGGESLLRFYMSGGGLDADITLSITAEFPQEDTGYIEDGFDYCLHTGANLVSSPCRDEVAIESAIPSDILQNITGIITEGGAASNLGGNWVGSLNGLGGGKGYWVISDIDGCFNYTCSEEN